MPEAARREAKRQQAERRDGARAEGTNGEAVPAAPSPIGAKALGHEEARSEMTPLSEFCTGCTAVTSLGCVECYIIMFLPREYSKMLAVRGRKGILAGE